MAKCAQANSGVGFGMVKVTYKATEQIETLFTSFVKGLGTNTLDDVSRLEFLEASPSKNQMPMIPGEITRFAIYNQTPSLYDHLAQNCFGMSGKAPNMARVTYV